MFLTLPVIPSFSQSLPSWVPKNGLAAYYGFDKDARDASGNRNDGVVHEATLIPDRFGIDSSAYNFNGTSSFIDVRDTASMNPVSGLSLSMWVHTETPHGVAGVLGKWNNYGGSFGIGREQFCMNVSDTDNGINFGLKTKDEFPVYPHEKEIIYRNGRWNHYIGTYDGAYAKLYVNGILASTYRASGPIPVYQQKFEIGLWDPCSFQRFLDACSRPAHFLLQVDHRVENVPIANHDLPLPQRHTNRRCDVHQVYR